MSDRVVYVDGSHRHLADYDEALPKLGRIYTIRKIVPRGTPGFDEDGVLLVEIINPPEWYVSCEGRSLLQELHFRARRFRPLGTTNIDVFLKMLELAPVRKPERVA